MDFYNAKNQKIGSLIDGVFRKKEKITDVFRKTLAWSVPIEVMQKAQRVVYETDGAIFEIDTNVCLLYPIMTFNGETKCYIPVRDWEVKFTKKIDMHIYSHLGPDWYCLLRPEFDMGYMRGIMSFLQQRRKEVIVYPDSADVFKAFRLCSPLDTKVVIIGQDPYPGGEADGIAFSSKKGYPKSLKIIHTAMERELDTLYLDPPTTLDYLSNQGILLLNSSLTVEHGKPGSHKNLGWDLFLKKALKHLKDPVICFYGAIARDTFKDSFSSPFSTAHPAAEARGSAKFYGYFKEINHELVLRNQKPVTWIQKKDPSA